MTTELETNAPYKYTVPIQKAFIGEDGKPRLIGAASGPEVDVEGHRISKSLLEKWVHSINTGQMEVVYDDWHRQDSATADLGTIEKAWLDENDHMWVQVLLDEDNPVASYIHKAARKGKQYGMSIFGKATRFVDEVVSGQRVRTIMDGTLTRIAHTTRPVWTPSFGTVLSKAIDSASESAKGDDSVSETETPQDNKGVENPDETATTDEAGNESTPEAPKTEETIPTGDGGEVTVEKAITADTKKDEKTLQSILKTYKQLGSQLQAAGLDLSEEAAAAGDSTETTVAKAIVTEDDRVVRIEKSLTTLTEAVTALAELTPNKNVIPGVLRKSEETDPLTELKSIEDPMERLRLAFAATHNEGVR